MPPGTMKAKSNIYDGQEYLAFKDWKAFAVAYTDYLTFSRGFDDILLSYDYMGQVELLSLTKESPEDYNVRIIETLTKLNEWQRRSLSLKSS